MGPFFVLSLCFLGFNLLRYYNIIIIGLPSSHVLLPFQNGILYRSGRPVRVLGPGRHRVFVGREKILFLDVRPIQFNGVNRVVTLADGATAVYSFNASAKVNDIQKAIYASATCIQFPAFLALCVTRDAISKRLSTQLTIGRTSLEEEVRAAYQSRLAKSGFELASFQFTQLAIVGAAKPQN